MKLTIALIIAYILDLMLGDPAWLPHPIIWIGKLISALEKGLRKSIKSESVAGTVMMLLVVLITGGVTYGLIFLAYRINIYAGLALETFWMYQIFATKSLKQESMKVYKALRKSLDDGRKAVSYIVGRDTADLDEKGVIKSTVETIAENTTDGVIAPILYCAIGGAGLGMIYKAINTMDSMVGYKNKRYRYFGTAAARLDDIANFIPARLSGLIMILASGLGGLNMKNAAKIFKRDRYNHKSPNSAQTESVCAGALEVQLAGNAVYFGELYEKPTIGDPIRAIRRRDIKRANRLMMIASFIAMLLCVGIRLAIFL